MSKVLYYSNYCEHCKIILSKLSQSSIKEELHFLCLDNRVKKVEDIYILLENGTEVFLPKMIRSVPSLLFIKENKLMVGKEVKDYILNEINMKLQKDQLYQGEPDCFALNQFGNIISDQYSYLDQNSDEMSAKGKGGLRQIHNYVTIDYQDSIFTPPEDYVPDKVGSDSLDKIREEREKDVPREIKRM